MIRCLIVDDNSFDRKLLRRAAEGCQLEIGFREAFDIRSAENILEAEDFDCIILDFRLPDGDGLSFAKRLMAGTENELPLIMITGRGNEDVAREAFHLGIVDYVTKENLSPEKLERVVLHALAKTRLQRAQQSFLAEIVEDALKQFASCFARDLMTPIGKIGSSCASLRENHLKDLNAEGQQLLKEVEEAAERTSTLLQGSLAYAELAGARKRHSNAAPAAEEPTVQ